MIIELNGRPHELADDATLDGVIAAVAGSTRGSAAAVDGVVVPRGEWTGFRLRPGQAVEVITAVQGG